MAEDNIVEPVQSLGEETVDRGILDRLLGRGEEPQAATTATPQEEVRQVEPGTCIRHGVALDEDEKCPECGWDAKSHRRNP